MKKNIFIIIIFFISVLLVACSVFDTDINQISNKFNNKHLNSDVIINDISYSIETEANSYKIIIDENGKQQEIEGMYKSGFQQILLYDYDNLYYDISTEENTYICKFNLKKQTEECIATIPVCSSVISMNFMIKNNKVYYFDHGEKQSLILHSYDIKTGESRQYGYNILNDFDISGDKIFYNTIIDETENGIPKIIESDLNNEENKKVLATTYSKDLSYCNNRLYYINTSTVKSIDIYQPDNLLYSIDDKSNNIQKELNKPIGAYYIVADTIFYTSEGSLYKIKKGEEEKIYSYVWKNNLYFSGDGLRFYEYPTLLEQKGIERYVYDLKKDEVIKIKNDL